jgi:Family of unknown function (DUF6544)
MGKLARMAIGAGAAFAVVAASLSGGRLLFERRVSGEVERLFAASQVSQPSIVTEADLAGLPAPVQRWLHSANAVGHERPVTIRLRQEGQFRLSEDKGWMPYTAEQYFTTDPPGFIWSASFQMAPLLSVRGRDRYVDGRGDIDMRLLSLVPVAKKSGGGLNQGALLRYLGEIAWFPGAALSPHITWEEVDSTSARATMSYQGTTASATFTFDEQGRITAITAKRYNDAKGRIEAWTIPIRAYGEFNGIQVPVEGEGVWNYSSGDFTYIRWRITNIEYNQTSLY